MMLCGFDNPLDALQYVLKMQVWISYFTLLSLWHSTLTLLGCPYTRSLAYCAQIPPWDPGRSSPRTCKLQSSFAAPPPQQCAHFAGSRVALAWPPGRNVHHHRRTRCHRPSALWKGVLGALKIYNVLHRAYSSDWGSNTGAGDPRFWRAVLGWRPDLGVSSQQQEWDSQEEALQGDGCHS